MIKLLIKKLNCIISNERLGFNPVKTCFSENLTPINQLLAWKCGELKRASMIHSTWSVQGGIRTRRAANERALLIENYNGFKSIQILYLGIDS